MPDKITLANIAQRLDELGRGERGAYVDAQAAFYGISRATLFRQLREVGWSSGRRARADKGATRASERALQLAAALGREGIRKNGKSTMALTTAVSVLVANGCEPGVGNDQLRRVLRGRRLDRASQTQDAPAVTMRAPHPNYLQQVDPSLCVVYYLRGEQHIMREDVFYKNKPGNLARVQLKVWRYTLWDAASGALAVRYFEAAGETQENLVEFLLWAWSTRDRCPPYGVPRLLGLDPGSANTGHALRALCGALDVELLVHRPGAARVNGGVEGAQNLVETQFESRLRFEPVESVEALNAAAGAWCRAWNENLIPGYDARLTRRGAVLGARADLWRLITAEQLRLLPEIEVCRALLEGRVEERRVLPGLEISFRHPASKRTRRYSVAGLAGVSRGDTVRVSPLVYGALAIRVRVARYDGEDAVYRLEPTAEVDAFGQPLDAPVWGESFKALPRTDVERQGEVLDGIAYPGADAEGIRKLRARNATPMLGALEGRNLNAHSHLKDVVGPATLPRRGETISVPNHVAAAAPVPMTHFAACRALAQLLGRALSAEENAQVRGWYPEGVMEMDLPMLAQCLGSGSTPFNAARAGGRREAAG